MTLKRADFNLLQKAQKIEYWINFTQQSKQSWKLKNIQTDEFSMIEKKSEMTQIDESHVLLQNAFVHKALVSLVDRMHLDEGGNQSPSISREKRLCSQKCT